MQSHLLTETISDSRECMISRNGMEVLLESGGSIWELSGGSHASAIVHGGEEIIQTVGNRLQEANCALTGRAISHPLQIELANIVCNEYGDQNARVFFTSSGTDAVETAVRLAYHIQSERGKNDSVIVIGKQYSYHGMSVLTRNIESHPVHSRMIPSLNYGWPKIPEPSCNHCCFTRTNCNLQCAYELLNLIKDHGQDRIAAVIIEPISGSTGAALIPPPKYIETIAGICREHGILLIADETITAFGRTGRSFLSSDYADITVGGKLLAGGFAALNSVIVSGKLCDELMQYSNPLPLRLTFSAPPYEALMAICVQEYIHDHQILENVRNHDLIIRKMLEDEISKHPSHVQINGCGHLWGLEWIVSIGTGKEAYSKLKDIATKMSVECMGGFRNYFDCDVCHIMFTPPLDAKLDELQHSVDIIGELIDNYERKRYIFE